MSLLPTDLVDRAATLVAGVVVACVGAAAALWPTHVVHAAPEQISTGPAERVTRRRGGRGNWLGRARCC